MDSTRLEGADLVGADADAIERISELLELFNSSQTPEELGEMISEYTDENPSVERTPTPRPAPDGPLIERLSGAEALTPGSDLSFGFRDEFLNWGRIGNDVLISYKPSNPLENSDRVDLMLGDIADEQLFPDSFDESELITPLQWEDTFVLGDWNQPYYTDPDRRFSGGFEELAIIGDFVPAADKIRLHGSASDYTLNTISLLGLSFQVLAYKQPASPVNPNQPPSEVTDAVALITNLFGTAAGPGVPLPDLDLNADYFEYVGTEAPASAGFESILQSGTEGIELSLAIETDSFGNFYVAGATDGPLDGETGEGSYDVSLTKYDAEGNQVWVRKFGTPFADVAFGLAADDTSVYLTGVTSGDLAGDNAGGQDIWLGRFDGDTGEAVWTNQFGDPGVDASQGIDVDENGDVYLSGLQTKPTPPDTANFPLTDDSFVAKFDGDDGSLIFQTAFGTEPVPGNAAFDESYDVAVGNDGSLFASGWTLSNLENPGSTGNKSENGLYDVWVSRFDEEGNQLWLQQIGTPAYEFLWDIEVDAANNAYVSGWTLGDFDGEGNAGSYDVWLSKFDADGNQLWTEQFGTAGDDGSFLGGMEVKSAGDIFLTGYTRDAFVGENAGLTDVWVSRFDTDGNQQWIQQFGTASDDFSADITINDSGTLYVTGHTEGSFNSTQLNKGSFDSWVAALDSENGSLLPVVANENPIIAEPGDRSPIRGDNSDNYIAGRAGDNKLFGYGGDDVLIGDLEEPGGKDVIFAGSGDDTVSGGSGDDRLFGETGDDTIRGDEGDDLLRGGRGHDVLDGGGGDDRLFGEQGSDSLAGGAGDDVLSGDAGNETLDGGAGEARLFGGAGSDTVGGGGG
ncbi:MAG: SBBP repeat-containing protein, partial [Phormidesmis sp.]